MTFSPKSNLSRERLSEFWEKSEIIDLSDDSQSFAGDKNSHRRNTGKPNYRFDKADPDNPQHSKGQKLSKVYDSKMNLNIIVQSLENSFEEPKKSSRSKQSSSRRRGKKPA